MSKGWVKMDRDYRETAGFKNEKYSRPEAYLDLICLANWDDKTWRGITIKRGSFATSKQALADRWKWTRQSVLRLLKTLKNRTLIDAQTVRTTDGECTLVTILDYDKNQRIMSSDDLGSVLRTDNKRTLDVPEPYPTKEEELRIRNKNIITNSYSKSITRSARTQTPKDQFGEFVFLTKEEHQKFILEFGLEFLNAAIEKLNSWIGSNPLPKRKTNGKNAAATFRAWVFNSIAEQQAKAQRVNGYAKPAPKSHQDQILETMKTIFEEAKQNEN